MMRSRGMGDMEPSKMYKKGGKAKKGKKPKKSNWIQEAVKKPGALRKSLGVKKGKKIPFKKLVDAAEKPGKLGRRARLARTFANMRKK
jgi:hypothetical protein